MGNFVKPDEGEIEWKEMDDDKYSEYMPQIDWEKVYAFNLLYISSQFDVMEWWKSDGKKKYPLIALVALVILALPPSNAFLERIFGTCTWFDHHLRQRLKFSRYEMAQNTPNMSCCGVARVLIMQRVLCWYQP